MKALFGEFAKDIESIHSDVGDCWFVSFDAEGIDPEELVIKALEFVRTQKFQDKPVRARLKTENLLRSL